MVARTCVTTHIMTMLSILTILDHVGHVGHLGNVPKVVKMVNIRGGGIFGYLEGRVHCGLLRKVYYSLKERSNCNTCNDL